MNLTIPDAQVRFTALESITSNALKANTALGLRYAMLCTQLGLPHVVTERSLDQIYDFLLNEFQEAAANARTTSNQSTDQPQANFGTKGEQSKGKGKKGDSKGKGSGESKGKGKGHGRHIKIDKGTPGSPGWTMAYGEALQHPSQPQDYAYPYAGVEDSPLLSAQEQALVAARNETMAPLTADWFE